MLQEQGDSSRGELATSGATSGRATPTAVIPRSGTHVLARFLRAGKARRAPSAPVAPGARARPRRHSRLSDRAGASGRMKAAFLTGMEGCPTAACWRPTAVIGARVECSQCAGRGLLRARHASLMTTGRARRTGRDPRRRRRCLQTLRSRRRLLLHRAAPKTTKTATTPTAARLAVGPA